MNIQLSTYNFLAIVCPGGLALCIILIFYPELRFIANSAPLTITILICLGEIVQGVGNILEAITKFPHRLTDNKLKNNGIELPYNEVYRLLKQDNLTERLDIYVEKYGLSRGIFVVALISSLFMLIREICRRSWDFLPFFCGTIFFSFICYAIAYRLRHFASLYTNEMIAQYNNYKLQRVNKKN